MMEQRQFQLKLFWNPENAVWPEMPETARSDCLELLAQLLRSVVTAERNERSENDERQDFRSAS